MKKLCIISLTLFFIKCASATFNSNPPFTITKAIYQNWSGGVKGITGMHVTINYTSNESIQFKELFFRGKKKTINIKKLKNGENTLFVKFNNHNTNNFDIQLHADAKKEFGNKPSKKETNIPFELKDTEAVLSYKEDNELKYFKIESIEKGKQIILQ